MGNSFTISDRLLEALVATGVLSAEDARLSSEELATKLVSVPPDDLRSALDRYLPAGGQEVETFMERLGRSASRTPAIVTLMAGAYVERLLESEGREDEAQIWRVFEKIENSNLRDKIRHHLMKFMEAQSLDEFKKAWRAVLRLAHPDRATGSAEFTDTFIQFALRRKRKLNREADQPGGSSIDKPGGEGGTSSMAIFPFLAALSYGPNVENDQPIVFHDDNPVSRLESPDYSTEEEQSEVEQDVSDESLLLSAESAFQNDDDGLTSGLLSRRPSWGIGTPVASWTAIFPVTGFAGSPLARVVVR